MKPGREIDTAIAQLVFQYEVFKNKKQLWEKTPKGDRPLRNYTKDIESAWEIVEKLGITLIPVENDQWFALVGGKDRWSGPADFINYLQKADFINSGAAVGENAPMTICLAAIRAVNARVESEKNPEQQMVVQLEETEMEMVNEINKEINKEIKEVKKEEKKEEEKKEKVQSERKHSHNSSPLQ